MKAVLSQIGTSDTDMKRVLYLLQKEKFFLENLRHATAKPANPPSENDEKTPTVYSNPIGSHLYLIYVKLHLLLDWKNRASVECENLESQMSPLPSSGPFSEGKKSPSSSPNSKKHTGAPFAKNLIKNRLELFFNPLSEIVGLLKGYWTELLDHIVKIQSVEGARIYDPYSTDASSTTIRKDFNPNSLPWFEMYSNLLSIYARIISSRGGRYKSSTQLDFISVDGFLSPWNHLIVSNISRAFKEHKIAGTNETLLDLLGRIDGPFCLGLVAWIYLFAFPSFATIFSDATPSPKHQVFIFCSVFLSSIKSSLTQYLEPELKAMNAGHSDSTLLGIPPSDCLYFLSWLAMSQKRIHSILSHSGNRGAAIPEILSEDQIEILIRRYISHTTTMVREWLGNLLSAEVQKLKLRMEPPDSDRFGKYFASVTGEVFLFLDQV